MNIIWRLHPEVVSTILNEGAVLLDLRSKFFFSANATAWAVVQMFETGATPESVLAAAQDWGAQTDLGEVKNLLDQLLAEGLVEQVEETPPPLPLVTVTSWQTPTLEKHREPLQRIMVSAFDPGMPMAE